MKGGDGWFPRKKKKGKSESPCPRYSETSTYLSRGEKSMGRLRAQTAY